MENYILYDKNTGEILRTGTCGHESYDKQAKEGQSIMRGRANDVTQKVNLKNRKIEQKNKAEI